MTISKRKPSAKVLAKSLFRLVLEAERLAAKLNQFGNGQYVTSVESAARQISSAAMRLEQSAFGN
ncbi:hypothetical protein [Curvibacter sp. AEP1-3]|uniref:hypothetical protein n=1 Tax=Curvibacter sp. AEP1-3 TaxID=1844971 RepID=UPI0012FB52E1|nr:hypothetical protein [Curvibacter sp. AEP1-3]